MDAQLNGAINIMSSYSFVDVESFNPNNSCEVHVRPLAGQPNFPTNLRVECSKSIVRNYPVATRFRINGKLSFMKGVACVYSSYRWNYEVLG